MSKLNINFNDKNFEVDTASLSEVRSDFISHLGTIAGEGTKIIVDGVEYSVDTNKLSGATSALQTAFENLSGEVPEEERLEGDGAEYYTLAPTALSFRSTQPLSEFQEVKVNGQTVDPANYTLEEGSTIVKLSIDYLKTLDAGDYDVVVVSQNKTVGGNFTVKAPELNEYGFYYNQPYIGFVDYFGAHVGMFIHENGTLESMVIENGTIEICTYVINDGVITMTSPSMGELHGTFSVNGMELYNSELNTTLKLGDSPMIVADEDYIYALTELWSETCYAVFFVIDNTKTSYPPIRTGINGLPTKAINENAFIGCKNLVSITIPSCIEFVAGDAFYGCTNLDEVIFENCEVGWWSYPFPDSPLSKGVIKKHSYFKNDHICDICGKCGHLHTELRNTKEPTCSEEGYTGDTYCVDCGAKIKSGSAIPIIEHLHVELRNTKEPTCSEEGYTGDIVCLDCGMTVTNGSAISSLGHIDDDSNSYCDRCGQSLIGLLDKNGNLIASWDDLVNVYGMDVSTNYTVSNYKTSTTSPYYILTKNSNLNSGVKMNLGDITTIGDYAFAGCSLTEITIPDSVTSIGKYAFDNCSNLTSITIPGSVTNIGEGAFYNCANLTRVTLTYGVTTIAGYAFRNCSSLTSVTIPDSVTRIGDYAFAGCSLTEITIPDSVTSIGQYAFRNCSSLKSILFEENSKLTSIGSDAFYNCSGLTSVTIPASVTSIGSDAFEGCSGLTKITFNGTITQWNAVSKGIQWNYNVPATHVHCIDGDVAL